jgi:hypothetical protein
VAANDLRSADIQKIPDSLHLAFLNPEPEHTGRPRYQTLLAIICSFIVAGSLALVVTVPFWVSPESALAEWIVSASPGWLLTNSIWGHLNRPDNSFGNIGIIGVAFSVNTFIFFLAILGLTLWIDKRRRKKRSKLV